MNHIQKADHLVRNLFGDRYVLYSDGRIYGYKKRKWLSPYIKSDGYTYVCLSSGKYQRKQYLLHRLLAENFIPNPDNKKEVNHIDGTKQNNSLSNLEWVTPQENVRHAHKNGLRCPSPSSGEKYISFHENRYKVRVRTGGKDKCYGVFKTMEEAKVCRDKVLKESKHYSIV